MYKGAVRGQGTRLQERTKEVAARCGGTQPNIGLQATAYSLRSYVASAFGSA
jgi:hypothetical protein